MGRPESEVDRLIGERAPFSQQHSRRRETARLYLDLRKLAVPKGLLLYSRDEFESFKDSPRPISYTLLDVYKRQKEMFTELEGLRRAVSSVITII